MKEPSKQDIEKIKSIFGPLHKVTVEGDSYIVRALSIRDLIDLGVFKEITFDSEESIVKNGLVFPIDVEISELPAGTVSILSNLILDKSGVLTKESMDDALARARKRKTIFTEIYSFICCGFPAILPGDLESLTMDKLMDLVIMAEEILMMQDVIQTEFAFEDPKEGTKETEDKTAIMLQQAFQDAKAKGYIS